MITKLANSLTFSSPTRSPVKVSEMALPNTWKEGKYFVEEHKATTRHYDFSIIYGGKVYRMARSPGDSGGNKSGFLGVFPGPSERSGWVAQPEHLASEVPNPKVIADGYGKGTTKVVKTGKCLVRKSESGTAEFILEGVDGTYALIEAGFPQVLLVRKKVDSPWIGKHKMKDDRDIDKYISDPKKVLLGKYDGTAVDWQITNHKGKKYLKVFSYRPDARLEKKYGVRAQIEHTNRLSLADKPLPDDVPVAKGRGELWVPGAGGFGRLTALLNSDVVRAKLNPLEPKLVLHDVEGGAAFKDRLEILKDLAKKDKRFTLPLVASTPIAKKKLWDKLRKDPAFDGVIAQDLTVATTPIKIKYKFDTENEHMATIVDVRPQAGSKGHLGYPIVENSRGARFKLSGLGLSEAKKADMLSNPDEYIGKEVVYSAERHFSSGLPWQPTLLRIIK